MRNTYFGYTAVAGNGNVHNGGLRLRCWEGVEKEAVLAIEMKHGRDCKILQLRPIAKKTYDHLQKANLKLTEAKV